jgi:hypothetical protein
LDCACPVVTDHFPDLPADQHRGLELHELGFVQLCGLEKLPAHFHLVRFYRGAGE